MPHRYASRQALVSAISHCLRKVPKSAYHDAFQKWIQKLKLHVHVCILNREE